MLLEEIKDQLKVGDFILVCDTLNGYARLQKFHTMHQISDENELNKYRNDYLLNTIGDNHPVKYVYHKSLEEVLGTE